MHRRNFIRQNSILVAGAALSRVPANRKKNKKLKPARLKEGASIGFITPGSFLDDEGLQKAVSNVEGLGFRVVLSKHIREQKGFIAGTDEQRLADLRWAFHDQQVDAVWCARGGYGCSRLLPFLDYKLIRRNPKILIGYSDITALVNAIYQQTGLVTFHGPVAASDFTDFTKHHLLSVLMEGKSGHEIVPPADPEETVEPLSFHAKKVTGELVGGNLSLLAAMAGTPYAPDFHNKIAFIEDIGEKPYRIDRMLTQLRQACRLDKACAIALGDFSGCDSSEPTSLTLEETLTDRLTFKGIPVGYRFPFGHTADHCTLPVGTKVELDVAEKKMMLLESPVV